VNVEKKEIGHITVNENCAWQNHKIMKNSPYNPYLAEVTGMED